VYNVTPIFTGLDNIYIYILITSPFRHSLPCLFQDGEANSGEEGSGSDDDDGAGEAEVGSSCEANEDEDVTLLVCLVL
jgi:hypothetical protein